MLFNTVEFLLFFVITYSLYLLSRANFRLQNKILLGASIVFYGSWDWRFLWLLIGTTALDYFMGLKIDGTKNPAGKKFFLAVSVTANLSVLGFFKYFNFFSDTSYSLLSALGFNPPPFVLNVVLPVGISFYTFQAMSYTIDVYRGNLKAVRSYPDFALFVLFFPQLIAGPIERATHLLRQVAVPRNMTLEKAVRGIMLICFGLFQKIFIADNLQRLVIPLFSPSAELTSGYSVLIASYLFAFQIYCDFGAYSNICRGLGSMMGFEIVKNFDLPYFSKNPKEFWSRWHISLSQWLRDYLYIPLGGNKGGTLKTCRNLMITMLLGGLWHGASWHFVFWGFYHGVLLAAHRFLEPFLVRIKFSNPFVSAAQSALTRLFFFHLVCVGWIFFRAETLGQSFYMLKLLFFNFQLPPLGQFLLDFRALTFFLSILIVLEITQFIKKDSWTPARLSPGTQAAFYILCFYLTLVYGVTGGAEFIYFQF